MAIGLSVISHQFKLELMYPFCYLHQVSLKEQWQTFLPVSINMHYLIDTKQCWSILFSQHISLFEQSCGSNPQYFPQNYVCMVFSLINNLQGKLWGDWLWDKIVINSVVRDVSDRWGRRGTVFPSQLIHFFARWIKTTKISSKIMWITPK